MLFALALLASAPADEPAVRVTVVVVLASADHTDIDPKLAALAKEVRKRDPKLTGFKLASTEAKAVAVGDTATFPLVDKKELKVKVEKAADADGKIGLTVHPPGLGEVTYSCAADKFFPLAVPHKTEAGETVVVAVMAKVEKK